MIEGLQIAIPQRMSMVRVILVLSLIISMLAGLNLWAGARHFPQTPLIWSGQLFPPTDYLLPGITILSWICSLFLRKDRLFLLLSFLLSVWMVLNDINRLQPWFYIYNSMLVIFIIYNGRVDDPNRYTSFFIILQTILASSYFFMGFHRMQPEYITNEFVDLILPLREFLSERQFQLFVKLGYSVPYILMFIGVGLMISPIRYLAISLAVLIHLCLLIFLFPSQAHQNYALWLSNVSYLLMVMLLFSGKTKQRYYSPAFIFQMPLFYLVAVLFVVMPFFSNSGRWPAFLSSDFRNGRPEPAAISIDKGLHKKLPLYEKQFFYSKGDGFELDVRSWCRDELHAEPFRDIRVYHSIAEYLERSGAGPVKVSELEN